MHEIQAHPINCREWLVAGNKLDKKYVCMQSLWFLFFFIINCYCLPLLFNVNFIICHVIIILNLLVMLPRIELPRIEISLLFLPTQTFSDFESLLLHYASHASLTAFTIDSPLLLPPSQSHMGPFQIQKALRRTRRAGPRLPPGLRQLSRDAAAVECRGGVETHLRWRHITRYSSPGCAVLLPLVNGLREELPVLVWDKTQACYSRSGYDQRAVGEH